MLSLVLNHKPVSVSSKGTYVHTNNQSQPHAVDSEFLHMSQAYQSADITTVTGAVGPLYYATVTVQGTAVQTLVDPESSATIMSFQLFCKIGEAAHNYFSLCTTKTRYPAERL